VVDYNARVPGGGLDGLNEFDVVGYDFDGDRVFLCEVTTHIRGLNYGSYQSTVQKVRDKFERQRAYARARLGRFKSISYQLWSPYVPTGFLTENLAAIEGLELVVNAAYRTKIETLRTRAETDKHEHGQPVLPRSTDHKGHESGLEVVWVTAPRSTNVKLALP
jgi:hypothetical protein